MLNADQLKVWVDYANEHGSIIMFDAAYERFISEEGVLHSIYEIEGAKRVQSNSVLSLRRQVLRCSLRLHPLSLKPFERDGESLNAMWSRRQCTKFNGASYIIQRGAAAIYTDEARNRLRKRSITTVPMLALSKKAWNVQALKCTAR